MQERPARALEDRSKGSFNGECSVPFSYIQKKKFTSHMKHYHFTLIKIESIYPYLIGAEAFLQL